MLQNTAKEAQMRLNKNVILKYKSVSFAVFKSIILNGGKTGQKHTAKQWH